MTILMVFEVNVMVDMVNLMVDGMCDKVYWTVDMAL